MPRSSLALAAVVCGTTLSACTSQAAPDEAVPDTAASTLKQDMTGGCIARYGSHEHE